jgi:DNA (cytosine-5)-methyltransferase 1
MDPLAAETYRLNHPSTRLYVDDIRNIDAERFAVEVSDRNVDLLAACPPCQGFSTIRTLRRTIAVSDERNELVLDVLRFIKTLRPRAVLFENVPGLAKDSRFRRFTIDLEKQGYFVRYRIVDAADYGMPQRRRRLVLMASQTEFDWPSPTSRRRRTVHDAIGALSLVGRSGDPLHDYSVRRTPLVTARIARLPKDG